MSFVGYFQKFVFNINSIIVHEFLDDYKGYDFTFDKHKICLDKKNRYIQLFTNSGNYN